MTDTSIPYTIKSSKQARNVRITVKTTGEVIVTKPWFMPMLVVNQFIKANEKWIQDRVIESRKKLEEVTENSIWYLGNRHTVIIKKGRLHIDWDPSTLTCTITAISESSAKRALREWLQKKAKQTVIEMVKLWSERMQLAYNTIHLRDQSTRWGSCSTKKNLNFSWRLIMAPPQSLTYVVIHELAHLKHMNHSQHFWSLVEKYDPDYRDHRRWLKKHQVKLQVLN